VTNTPKNDLCKQLWKRINSLRGYKKKSHHIKLQVDEKKIESEADVVEVSEKLPKKKEKTSTITSSSQKLKKTR
jgi:hypothetical protein